MEQVFVQSLNSLVKINFLQTFFILVLIKDHFYLVMKMVQCFCIHLIRDLMFDFLTKFWLCLAYTDTRLTRHTLPFGTGVSGSGFAGVEPSEL